MKLEVGKYYEDRDGEVYGPLGESYMNIYKFCYGSKTWTEDGVHDIAVQGSTSYDLIQEVSFDGSPIEAKVKTWGEMTPEEQGALLLAHHNGETIEFLLGYEPWLAVSAPSWTDTFAYRVKPTVETETVLWGSGVIFDTHKITFDTVGGEPDVSTVKMEKL